MMKPARGAEKQEQQVFASVYAYFAYAYAYAYFAFSYDNIFMKMLTKKKQTVMMKPARGAQKQELQKFLPDMPRIVFGLMGEEFGKKGDDG